MILSRIYLIDLLTIRTYNSGEAEEKSAFIFYSIEMREIMRYTQEQIDAIERRCAALADLGNELRKVLDASKYNFLSTKTKVEVLRDLEMMVILSVD